MNFNEWQAKLIGEDCDNTEKGAARDGWNACKKEVLKLLNRKIPKIEGMEGLGGCSWDEMGAEEFRRIIKKEIETL